MATFPAQAGTEYFLSTENVGRKADTKLDLVTSDGTVLATADDPDNYYSQLLWTCSTSGTYAVRISQSILALRGDLFGSAASYDIYVSPVSFADVPTNYWAFQQIESCAVAGIVVGYSDGYHPAEEVNRAQMAVYIARVLAGGDSNVPTPPAAAQFPDVPTSHWAYKYVESAYANLVVQGYPDGNYDPDLTVDRGQMATFIARARAPLSERPDLPSYVPPTTPSFPDVPADFWAYKVIEYCFVNGIVNGYSDGYHPELTVNAGPNGRLRGAGLRAIAKQAKTLDPRAGVWYNLEKFPIEAVKGSSRPRTRPQRAGIR